MYAEVARLHRYDWTIAQRLGGYLLPRGNRDDETAAADGQNSGKRGKPATDSPLHDHSQSMPMLASKADPASPGLTRSIGITDSHMSYTDRCRVSPALRGENLPSAGPSRPP